MQLGVLSWVGPGNHVLDGDLDAATVRGTFGVCGRLKSTVKQIILGVGVEGSAVQKQMDLS